MKISQFCCQLCGRNANESFGYLERVGDTGDPNAAFECRPGCEQTSKLNNNQRLIAAIEGWKA